MAKTLFNISDKIVAGNAPGELLAYRDRIIADGGTLETFAETEAEIRRLQSLGLYDSLSLGYVAGGYKASKWYNIKGATGDLDVVRETDGTRENRAGLINTLGNNLTRADFDAGVLKGNWVEASATTLVGNSAFVGTIGVGNTPTHWGYANVSGDGSRETKSSIKINGANAVRLNAGTGNRRSYLTQELTLPDGTHTIQLNIESYSGSGNARFFVITGIAGALNLNGFDGFDPNGTFPQKISQSFTATAGSGTFRIGFGTPGNDNQATDNDEITISGVDIKVGSFASTPIIHSGSGTATRNADNISKTGIASEIGQTEGVILVKFNLNNINATNNGRVFEINDGTATNRVLVRKASGNKLLGLQGSGLNNVIYNYSGINSGEIGLLIRQSGTTYTPFVRGVKGTDITLPENTTIDRLLIGSTPSYTSLAELDNTIQYFYHWKTTDGFTDAVCQQLTTL